MNYKLNKCSKSLGNKMLIEYYKNNKSIGYNNNK